MKPSTCPSDIIPITFLKEVLSTGSPRGGFCHWEYQDFSRWADACPCVIVLFVHLVFAAPCNGNSPGPGSETCTGPQSSPAACRHSRGPLACLSKEYLAQGPYDRLQRPRSPTHTCSRPPLVQSPLMTSSHDEKASERNNNTPAHEKQSENYKMENVGKKTKRWS